MPKKSVPSAGVQKKLPKPTEPSQRRDFTDGKESKITLPGAVEAKRKTTVSIPKMSPDRFGRPIGKKESTL